MREFRVGHDGGGIRIDQHHLVSFGTQRLARLDRKSTRLNSSHSQISYAVFCLKKKKPQLTTTFDTAIRLLPHGTSSCKDAPSLICQRTFKRRTAPTSDSNVAYIYSRRASH